MPKVHVVDRFLNEVLEYESEKDIEYHKIVEYRKHVDNEDMQNPPLITVKLDNGVILNYYDDDFDVFIDKNRTVYAPVYDVETCVKEDYSMYEEDDIIGFVNRKYDFANYLNFD